jgi:hypothetical protein
MTYEEREAARQAKYRKKLEDYIEAQESIVPILKSLLAYKDNPETISDIANYHFVFFEIQHLISPELFTAIEEVWIYNTEHPIL